jgi:hypothetical protein
VIKGKKETTNNVNMELKNVNSNGDNAVVSNLNNVNFFF